MPAMTRLLRSSICLATALTLPHLAGCSTRTSPSKATVEEQAFSFQVPGDWYPAAYDQQAKVHAFNEQTKTYDPAKGRLAGALARGGSLLYASPAGDYVYLEFDPGGHGVEDDLEWTVEVKDDRLVLQKEGPFCTKPPLDYQGWDSCLVGDGQLTIQIAPFDLVLRGHHYFLRFGNVRREQGVDHQVFRDILASFRAK